MPKHNIHHAKGKRKSKFAKQKVVQGLKNNLDAISEAGKLKSQMKCLVAQTSEKAAHVRRVVEIDTLAAEMWYKDCQIPISFRNVTGETQKGLASVLDVTCIKCNSLCAVHTNVYNPVNKSYEVNGKLAFGMIDASVGECHINTVLSATDVPTVLPTTMKKYERQVGVAQESCLEAVRLEKQMTLKNESIENK